MSSLVLIVISSEEQPIYEANLTMSPQKEEWTAIDQFIIHAAIECTEQSKWSQPSMFCKSSSKFGNYVVSSFVMANYTQIMLLHAASKPEEPIRNFFIEVSELLTKLQLSPFQSPTGIINSRAFDNCVYELAAKHLH